MTCVMLFLCETWGLFHTGQMCAVMMAGILYSSHALYAVHLVMITGIFAVLMRCLLYMQ